MITVKELTSNQHDHKIPVRVERTSRAETTYKSIQHHKKPSKSPNENTIEITIKMMGISELARRKDLQEPHDQNKYDVTKGRDRRKRDRTNRHGRKRVRAGKSRMQKIRGCPNGPQKNRATNKAVPRVPGIGNYIWVYIHKKNVD
jgi:hypothetical protein